MRPVFKYIFCGLVLAALIFIALCVFYIANTYAINTKNANKPVFPPYTASYFANVSTAEIREIEDTPPDPLSDGETESGIPDGSFPHFEPSEDAPAQDEPYVQEEQEDTNQSVVFQGYEPSSLLLEYRLLYEYAKTLNSYDYTEESFSAVIEIIELTDNLLGSYEFWYVFDTEDGYTFDTLITEMNKALDSLEFLSTDSPENEAYTEIDLLYSILETMKINQIIALFVLAVSLIIIIFKPIDKSFC